MYIIKEIRCGRIQYLIQRPVVYLYLWKQRDKNTERPLIRIRVLDRVESYNNRINNYVHV